MSKTKRTMMNAFIGIVQLVITGILSLITNRLIIEKLGSDSNGVNSTITQALAILSLLEGGFTTASLVALYHPYVSRDYNSMNVILSTTKNAFNRIGKYSFVAGALISFVFPLAMKSNTAYPELVMIFLLSVITLSFGFSVLLKYRLVFQVAQQEYIVTGIQLVSTVIIQVLSIIALYYSSSLLMLRAIAATISIFSGLVIIFVGKKKFAFMNFQHQIDYTSIKGTKDVFVTNITSYVYGSSSVLFLSTFVSTIATSIYAVYNSITSMVISTVNAIIYAPQSAFGQVIAEGNREKTYEVFILFEYITILLGCLLFATTYTLLVPFISIYTQGISDISYVDATIAILIILNSVFQIIHVPSGLSISLHGDFAAMRNIQLIATCILIVSTIIGAIKWNLYGIMSAKLLTSIYLAVTEMCYARYKIFNKSIKELLSVLISNLMVSSLLSVILQRILSVKIVSLGSFMVIAVINLTLIAISIFITNKILFPKMILKLQTYLHSVVKRKVISNP